MTFSVKGLFYLAGFLAAVALGVSAGDDGAAPWLAMAGIAALVLVDGILTFWPVVGGRRQ